MRKKSMSVFLLLTLFLNTFAIHKKYSEGYEMLPSKVNTKDSEKAMSFFNGNVVYSVIKEGQDPILYMATVNDTIELQDAQEMPKMTKLGIYGTFGHDAALNKIYFSKYDKSTKNFMLYESSQKGEKWSKPKKLKIKGMSSYRKEGSPLVNAGWLYRAPGISGFFNPTLANGGNRIYFTSDFPIGKGGRDIWFINKEEDGWSMPENVGDVVNTTGKEDYAFVSGDSLLYFSSNNGNSGGLDLFVSKIEDGKWSQSVPLDSIYNSSVNDYNLIGNEKGLFFISSRNTEQADDIFRPAQLKIVELELIEEPMPEPPVPVVEKKTFPWKLFYFDFDKDLFKPEFKDDLDELYLAMLEYIEEYNFVIKGHTDERGSVSYNERLSLKRATRIRALLIEKGIPAEKMVVEAFGESQPVHPNAKTETEHSLNRRVEVDLIKK